MEPRHPFRSNFAPDEDNNTINFLHIHTFRATAFTALPARIAARSSLTRLLFYSLGNKTIKNTAGCRVLYRNNIAGASSLSHYEAIGELRAVSLTKSPIICICLFGYLLNSSESLIASGYSFFPASWSTLSYQAAFNLGNTLWRSYLNSFFITAAGTVLSVFICIMYSYGLYRRDYPLRKFFAFFAFFTMIFGGGLAPTVVVIRNLLGLGVTNGF